MNMGMQRQWIKRFFWVNGIGIFLILLNYMAYMPSLSELPVAGWRTALLSYGFLFMALIGQSALFALLLGLFVTFIAAIFPKYFSFTKSIAVVCASTLILFLVFDSVIYHLYHYHVAGLVWQIVKSGVAAQILDLTWVEWLTAVVFLVVVFALEVALAIGLTTVLKKKARCFHVRYFMLASLACLFVSYTLALRTMNVPLKNTRALVNAHAMMLEAQIIPYYEKILGGLMPNKKSALSLETQGYGFFVQNKQVEKTLHYPLKKLIFSKQKKHKNIVIIALDAWRFDQMNPQSTPNIYRFSKRALVFEHNLSGGNATRPGIFSLFYSLPGTYWSTFLSEQKGPVFISALLKDHYHLGIFQSASLRYPNFAQTVFKEVHPLNLDTPGSNSVARDKKITNEFLHFIKKQNSQHPFFSFLFYDTTHNYCDPPVSYPTPFRPFVKTCDRLMLNNHTRPLPYINRYRNAIHFDDQLVGKVIERLKARHLLKNTIVIITSDHGEEFNESHLNYWGHASDYTPWQTHTPLVVFWPGEKHRRIRYRTSHYDVVPTLMKRVLGCTTPVKNYAVGHSLLKKGGRGLLIISSYIDFAIRLPNQIIRIYPQGNYSVQNLSGHEISGAALNLSAVHKAYQLMRRFF